MEDLNKAFDKKFGDIELSPFYLAKEAREEVLNFIRQREKELLKEIAELHTKWFVLDEPETDVEFNNFSRFWDSKGIKELEGKE